VKEKTKALLESAKNRKFWCKKTRELNAKAYKYFRSIGMRRCVEGLLLDIPKDERD
jgi:hypothetical protein